MNIGAPAIVVASVVFLSFGVKCEAATISVESGKGADKPAIVVVEGPLVPDDADLFRAKTGALSRAIVVLRSDGGNVVAGITIGEAIRLKGFTTLVIERCASACALAWLGGSPRFMTDGSQIGFHAAFDAQSGQETGAGNAVVGAYLTRIGLPYEAVIYITSAAPTSMNWLNSSEAKRFGIDVALFNPAPVEPERRPVGPAVQQFRD
jgi:hypothetical protein